QTALGNLRLVRGVGGVPARVLHHVAADHRGGDRVVVAVTDELLHRLILRRHRLERGERISLAQRVGQADRSLLSNGGRKGGLRERCGGLIAQVIQTLLGIAAVGPDVAVDKSCVISSHQAQAFGFVGVLTPPKSYRRLKTIVARVTLSGVGFLLCLNRLLRIPSAPGSFPLPSPRSRTAAPRS